MIGGMRYWKLREDLEGREDEGSRSALERSDILETLGPTPFDALLAAASGNDLINAAAQLGNYDIDTKRTRILEHQPWHRKYRASLLVGLVRNPTFGCGIRVFKIS